MGLSEREYMRTPDDPGLSNFGWCLIGIVVVGAVIMMHRSRQPHTFNTLKSDKHLEEQVVRSNPADNRRERLSRLSPLDINSATYEQLRLLPRITDTIADGIIAKRPFESIEELDDVYGIGPKTIELIQPHIVIN